MPYRNSLRRGPPKANGAHTGAAAAPAPKRNARTSSSTRRGEEEDGESEDNGDAHEPTGMTSDEGSDSESSGSDSDAADAGSDAEEAASDAGSASDSASADDGESDAFEPSASEHEEVEDDIESVASEEIDATPKAGRKRAAAAKAPAAKKRRKAAEEEEDDDDEDEIELAPGQKIVARIKTYPAPKAGQVPPGRISRNTLDFLGHLQYPKYNTREWFKSHEPTFRQAEKEWHDFVQVMQIKFNEADDELPVLPSRDICYRIYRDVRFSSDKSPYKSHFGLSYSRSGRKGIWAGYHLYIEPGGHTSMACGAWQPEKEHIAAIRRRILANPQQLRDAIARPAFVAMFGPPTPHPKRKRQNVFGQSDELKVAPKGFDKTHPDIDLLRLRSFTAVRRFSDEEVLDPHFVDRLKETVEVMAPFVHCINDMISPEEDDEFA